MENSEGSCAGGVHPVLLGIVAIQKYWGEVGIGILNEFVKFLERVEQKETEYIQ